MAYSVDRRRHSSFTLSYRNRNTFIPPIVLTPQKYSHSLPCSKSTSPRDGKQLRTRSKNSNLAVRASGPSATTILGLGCSQRRSCTSAIHFGHPSTLIVASLFFGIVSGPRAT